MRLAVFGTGGVGGYFGGRLAHAGEEVIFIARGPHLQAMRDHGLKVESTKGDFVVHPVQATDEPSSIGPVDVVLVCVKAWQVPDAAAAMRPSIGPDTCVLPLGNGVEAMDQLSSVLGREHVLGGICKIVSFIAAPGVIRHTGFEPEVIFGELDNRSTERVENLRAAFTRAGVSATVTPDIDVAVWTKFLFIAPYSGVGAVTRLPAGVVRRVPETRELMEKAMGEVLAVAKARGIAMPEDALKKAMAQVDALPEAATASMQRDIMAGRPSELEAQNGAVVNLGRETGVETPVNSFIYSCLLPSELKARGA